MTYGWVPMNNLASYDLETERNQMADSYYEQFKELVKVFRTDNPGGAFDVMTSKVLNSNWGK